MGVHTFVFGVLGLLAAANFGVSAQAAGSNLTIADIPVCGIQCLVAKIPESGCDITDIDCQCNDPDLAHTVSECMLRNCKMEEMVITSKVQASMCYLPDESRTQEVYMYIVMSYSIAIFFIGLRLWGKVVTGRLAIDDWACLGGILGIAIPLGCSLKMLSLGFGRHLWGMRNADDLKEILLLFWITATTYIIFLGTIKVSLVLLYVEIFPDKRTRTVAYIILVLIVANTLGMFLSSIFLCVPVRAFWELDIHAKCSNMNAIAYGVSGSSIGQDLILLIFPLVCIRNLNMKRKRKFAVGFMFCIGTFGCIATFLRLHTLIQFKTSVDPTWDYVDIAIWSALELLSGFVCISLPSTRMLFIHYLPKNLFSTITSLYSSENPLTPRKSQFYEDYNNNNSGEKQKYDWWDSVPNENLDSNTSNPATNTDLKPPPSHRLWPGSLATSPKPNFSEIIRSKSKSRFRSRSHEHPRTSFTLHPEVSLTHVRTATPQVPESRIASVIASRISSILSSSQENVELRTLRKSSQIRMSEEHICPSCGNQNELTALPRIGCLPDESFEVAEKEEEEVEEEINRGRNARRIGSVWTPPMV